MAKPRAKSANGRRLLHFRVNPPRQRRTCPVCGFNYAVKSHDLARNRMTVCSTTCRELRRWLIAQGLGDPVVAPRPRDSIEIADTAEAPAPASVPSPGTSGGT